MPTLNELHKSQSLDWGSIHWLAEPGNEGVERVSAGFLSFNAHSEQAEHVHIGYEQVMYVISGRGKHTVNGETCDLIPGSLVHIPPFARHAMSNEGDEPLTLVSMYFPLRSQQVASGDRNARPTSSEEYVIGGRDVLSFLDFDALGGLLGKVSQALGFKISLLDIKGNPIADSGNAPRFCAMLHDASKGRHCRSRVLAAIKEMRASGERRGKIFSCCSTVTSMLIPVEAGGDVQGYIQCGQVFLSNTDRLQLPEDVCGIAARYGISCKSLAEGAADIRVELKSVLYAAAEAALAIATYITEMAANASRREELDKSRLSLIQEQMATAQLEKALQEADFKLLQSQVNPHFLFNALSTVAQMAYVEGSEKIAEIVWSLSDLLHYSLRKTEEFIPLHEEIKLLRDYVKIQQARFGDRLQVLWDIDPAIEDAKVPGMLLQPLVENAIIHGLEPLVKPGVITIKAFREGPMLVCHVCDNGVGFDPATVAEKKDRIGLASIKSRLRHYYVGIFSFDIKSAPGKGTDIAVHLPFTGAGEIHA